MHQPRTAIITGGSRGIGRAVAEGLVQDGFSVALCARNKADLTAAAKEIQAKAPENVAVHTFAFDVSDLPAVQSMIREVHEHFGRVDLLFNNAGIYTAGSAELEPKELERLMDVNITGAWNLLHEVVPYMKHQGSGHIINLSSIVGIVGFAGVGGYALTKFALRGLNSSLFRELVPLGIKVTAICPSWVATDMAAHGPMPDEQKIQPVDLLQAVRYLISLSPYACMEEMVVQCRADLV